MDTRIARAIAPEKSVAARSAFATALLEGLRQTPKQIPCKYFYDSEGSLLFERICELPEYYQTRTEIEILRAHSAEIAELIGADADLVEYGAGSLLKVRILLDAMENPRAYTPIDISGDYLQTVVESLAADYPGLDLNPLVGDFTQPLILPRGAGRGIGFFPGSTIGNFKPREAVLLLRRMAGQLQGGGLLIGVDLVKDPAILHAAYNDAAGVTAAFNKNLLIRANRELDAGFDPDGFVHHACYNPLDRRVEMYLVSRARQSVRIGGETVHFSEGEAVHTEDSHKYTIAGFRALAAEAGFLPRAVWCDPQGLFSVHWLDVDERRPAL
jgi:dimethylhistidine N-methyltransferase